MSQSLYEASIATSQISQINLKRVSEAVKGIEITLLTLKFILFFVNATCTARLNRRDINLNEYLNIICFTSKYLGNNNLYIISSAFVFCQALLTFVLFIPSEVIAFKFITCFNYRSNGLVVARSIIIILYVVMKAVEIVLIECKVRVTALTKRRAFICIRYAMWMVIFLPFLCIFILNVVLLAKLHAPLDLKIEPDNIYMGFFNEKEISAIQSGNFVINATLSNFRIVGRLSYLNRDHLCYYSYVEYPSHISYEIDCSHPQNQLLFEDCAINNKYKTIMAIHMSTFKSDSTEYPHYSCTIKIYT